MQPLFEEFKINTIISTISHITEMLAKRYISEVLMWFVEKLNGLYKMYSTSFF